MSAVTQTPTGTMTRREFAGWMVASVVAMVAGSRIWRLFRRLAVEQRAYIAGYVNDVSNAIGRVTAIDAERGTIDITWGPAPYGSAPYAFDVAPTDRRYISSLFRVGETVAIPMVRG